MHLHNGFMMAMPMHNSFLVKFWWLVVRSLLLQEFAQEECLACQPFCIRIVRKEIRQFVTKDGCATGFQANHRNACLDLWAQRIKNIAQQSLRQIKKTIIVERATAAQ